MSSRRAARGRWIRCGVVGLLGALTIAHAPSADATGQEPPSTVATDAEERFRRLERIVAEQAEQIRKLADENRRLSDEVRADRDAPDAPATDLPAIPDDEDSSSALPAPSPPDPSTPDSSTPDESTPAPADLLGDGSDSGGTSWSAERSAFSSLLDAGNSAIPEPDQAAAARFFLTGLYDKGYVIVAPTDRQRTPFSLKVNVTSQVRYTGFARSVASWTNSAGTVAPVRNRSYFALNRNWFSFTGFAFSPNLRFNLTVLSTSATNQSIAFGGLSYEFAKALVVSGGYNKVPGTREWIESARYPLGADRTMANTFFRPGISPGVWAQGELPRGFFYYAGIFDDLSSVYNSASRTNTNMTYVGNAWWEPLGSFGPGYSDEEFHEAPAIRLGSSLLYHRSRREPDLASGQTNPENTILRLSDGTPLYLPGALAPGVTLQRANVILYSGDASLKYRGFSLSGEYYGRWIYNLDPAGAASRGRFPNLFDFGGLVQGSYALIPKKFELFARTSAVFGPFGDGSEYGGGANWYIYGNRNVRATFEAKRINHSPADNVLYGYFVGESGTLFQVQLLTDF